MPVTSEGSSHGHSAAFCLAGPTAFASRVSFTKQQRAPTYTTHWPAMPPFKDEQIIVRAT